MRKLENSELDRKSIEDFKQSEKTPIIIILDDIRSLHNIGSVFRTADAFLIEKVVLCGITPQPPHREIQKAALGATESVTWIYEKNAAEALKKLKQENFKIIGIEQTSNSENIDDFSVNNSEKQSYKSNNANTFLF